MLILRLILLEIVLVLVVIETGYTLKCRTEDGPSNGELKRVARSCMRKFGDLAFAHNSQQQQQQTPYQHHQQPIQGRYRQTTMSRENREDSEESDNSDFYDDQYYNNNNNRNYNRQQYGHNNNNKERNDHGGNNGAGHNDERQRNNNRYNTNNRTVSNGNNNNNNWNYLNQRNSLANNRGSGNNRNKNNNNNYNNNNNNNNQNNSFPDAACIVHCFFAEMHMLNHDDYPDRHKISYSLTKDIRDRELRNFYTDTIQECFRYLENQLRRNKCQFSRDLITCMTEYAKGNCDDWNEFNMIFN